MIKYRRFQDVFNTIMKITLGQAVIALVFAISSYGFESRGQELLEKKITIEAVGQDIKNVLIEIEKKAGVKFTYRPQILENRATLTFAFKNLELEEILDSILGSGISFEVIRDQIILSANNVKSKSLHDRSFSVLKLAFQKVSGKVLSEEKEPLPGVSVVLKGTTIGTVTDANGDYSLDIPTSSGVLVFSFIGYTNEEVEVTGKSVINVSLMPSLEALSEVVVIGYGKAKKSDLTGAVSTVPVDEIKKMPLTSIDQSLQGRAAGVQITQNSAAPGGSTTIRIRGGNSIQGDNEPLYVIDGMPFKNDGAASGASFNVLSTINPSDIESVTILKDASSTAIYGSRGANGVVIITTKRGKAGKSSVAFDTYYGTQQVRRKYPVLNGSEYAAFVNEANTNEGKAPVFTEEQVAAFGKGTDWQEEIFRDAPISNYQLTMTGGDDRTQYALSGGYFNQQGVVLNSGFNRASFRVNIDRKLSNRIKVGNSLTVSRTITNQSRTDGDLGQGGQVINNALVFPSILPVRNPDGTYLMTDPALALTADNPVALALDSRNVNKAHRALGNVFGEIEILKGLSFQSTLSFDGIFQKQDTYLPKTVVSGNSQGGLGSISNSQSLSWNFKNLIYFDKQLTDLHKIDLVAGYELQELRAEFSTASARSFVNDNLSSNDLGSGATPMNPSSGIGEWGLESYLTRLNYTFKDRYRLTASFRVDGSSRFGKNNRYGYFPSAALAWTVKQESFLTNVNFLSDLKLRASYGLTGNQDGIGNYPAYSLLGTQNYVFGGVVSTGIGPMQIANPDLSWETTSQGDIGVDIGFLKDRVTFTADVYQKTTKDLLLNVTIPSSSGFSTAFKNSGKLENKGIELSLNSENLVGAFKWSTNINYAANRSKVLDLGGAPEIFAGSVANIGQNLSSGVIRVGEPLGSFYGFVTDGIYQSEEELLALPDASAKKVGDRKYKDINPDGKIDDKDRIIIGRAQPKFIGGITNKFSYAGFELSIFLQGVYGNNILNANRFELEYLNGTTNQSRDMLDRWTPTNTDTDIPRASTTRPANRISTRQIEDGSYLRLKNVQLAYNLPSNLLNKISVQSIRIYVTAQNFATWTNYSGFDPEVNRFGQDSRSQGFDYGGYPAAKTLLVGFNIGL